MAAPPARHSLPVLTAPSPTVPGLLRSAAWASIAVLLITVLQSAFHFDGVPTVVPLALAALAVLAALRPADAVLVVAAVTPIASQQ